MRILADHCVYGKTVRLLRAHGCEVVTLHELGQADASDAEVLALAQSLDAVLITNDKGFGNILAGSSGNDVGPILLSFECRSRAAIRSPSPFIPLPLA